MRRWERHNRRASTWACSAAEQTANKARVVRDRLEVAALSIAIGTTDVHGEVGFVSTISVYTNDLGQRLRAITARVEYAVALPSEARQDSGSMRWRRFRGGKASGLAACGATHHPKHSRRADNGRGRRRLLRLRLILQTRWHLHLLIIIICQLRHKISELVSSWLQSIFRQIHLCLKFIPDVFNVQILKICNSRGFQDAQNHVSHRITLQIWPLLGSRFRCGADRCDGGRCGDGCGDWRSDGCGDWHSDRCGDWRSDGCSRRGNWCGDSLSTVLEHRDADSTVSSVSDIRSDMWALKVRLPAYNAPHSGAPCGLPPGQLASSPQIHWNTLHPRTHAGSTGEHGL